MYSKELSKFYLQHHNTEKFNKWLAGSGSNISLTGLSGSSGVLFASACIEKSRFINWFIVPDREQAAYIYGDLSNTLNEDNVYFFPSGYKRSMNETVNDEAGLILRTEVLNKLKNIGNIKLPVIFVSYPEALIEKVISAENLSKNTIELNVGETISITFIREALEEYNFEEVEFVYEPGQFSVRGSIVDIFSYSHHLPYRLDFFGDEVETIRTFDIDDQRSRDKFTSITIVPNIQKLVETNKGNCILKFLPADSVIWSVNLRLSIDRISDIYNKFPEKLNFEFGGTQTGKDNILLDGMEFEQLLKNFRHAEFGQNFEFRGASLDFSTSPQPVFRKNFDLLSQNLSEYNQKGYEVILISENPKQINRLKDIFSSLPEHVRFNSLVTSIHEGFIDHDIKLCIYTDHQIFERYHKYLINRQFIRSDVLTMNEIRNLQPGDYIVHIDHGIGIFGGLGKVEINGHQQESIRLVFKDNDVLYVNIHNLHKISKYRGKDGEPPKISKLGTPAWQNLKQNTKKKVKDIARELIALYAKRKSSEGFAYSQDTYMQEELEASFIYEDTPDQLKATVSVKENMERAFPMDHLICGDVGFGKTEIAIRAAFKAVSDNKQVVVLVPTTLLALQHYNTFSERLEKFPCSIDYISRLKSSKEQKETIKKLQEGQIDIIIGTHRIIGKDIKFKDLGLLIIDEEQKFGVAVKEKLKSIRINVDTLTLTATPIPRTLQFSLMGARDLSIISTPPPNRHPIQTEIHTFNETVIRDAIDYEVSRGGQVFFIYNRIDKLIDIALLINKLCPEVKVAVAHGQMDGELLEQIMMDFIRGDFDVLVTTTIIESGLDIPNANTMIINQAQMFGLSDLHQLRGRVGRSNKKAFCYLLAPPYSSLTQEARRRMKAIEEFSELGSGFNIAMQDLDIRGAGNLLGAEQSGFISEIGFETYQRILNEAMFELKEEEFGDLLSEKPADTINKTNDTQEQVSEPDYVMDCQVDTDMELMFPDAYIRNVTERIRLYRELDNIESEDKILEFERQLTDRFGTMPSATCELINVVRLRWIAKMLGFEKIILKNQKMLISFVSNKNSSYYQSHVFENILAFVQKNPKTFQMKEVKDKLSMTAENVKTIDEAIGLLKRMME